LVSGLEIVFVYFGLFRMITNYFRLLWTIYNRFNFSDYYGLLQTIGNYYRLVRPIMDNFGLFPII